MQCIQLGNQTIYIYIYVMLYVVPIQTELKLPDSMIISHHALFHKPDVGPSDSGTSQIQG